MRKHFFICVLVFLTGTGMTLLPGSPLRAQEVEFPLPDIPDVLDSREARLEFLLTHYWSKFNFADTTQVNQTTAEQGFVDFINLFQYADSAVCARAARHLADSLACGGEREKQFEELMDHYLGNPRSPLRDDRVYRHLLLALPATPQRTYLAQLLEANQVGMTIADIRFTAAGESRQRRLHECISGTTLVVFYDPQCEHCQELLPQIHEAFDPLPDLQVVYIDLERNPEASRHFYLPALPALYLVDANRHVAVRDGTIATIHQLCTGKE